MKEGSGMVEFEKKFPDRFYDVAIAEQHSVTFGAGLTLSGMKPIVAIYSSFLQRAYDQLIHDVCLENLDVISFSFGYSWDCWRRWTHSYSGN